MGQEEAASRKQKHTCSATRTTARTAKKAGARQLGPKKAIAQPQRQPCDYRSRIRPVTRGPRHVSAAADAATRVVRASTAMPASRSCRSRRRARDPVPRTCQQGRASQKVTSRIAQAEQAPQPNQAPAPPFAMPAAVKAARAGSGRAARLFGRYSALLASAHHDLRRDARVLERALSS